MSWNADAWLPVTEGRVAAVGEGLIELTAASPGSLRQSYGGDTLNTAIYLARCLSGSGLVIDYVSALGTDVLSDELMTAWRDEGLDVSHVARIENSLPGMYRVVLDETGERSFLYWRNRSAARLLLQDRTAAEWASSFMRHRLVYFSGISLAILDPDSRARCLEAMHLLSERGVIIAFDSNYRPALWEDSAYARAAIECALRTCQVALVSYDDERRLWGDASPALTARRISALGVKELVVKNGAAPCLVCMRERLSEVILDPVLRPVDTTAAGDAFNAGYLAGRLRGSSVMQCIRQAHALAAAVIQHPGAIVSRTITDTVLRTAR